MYLCGVTTAKDVHQCLTILLDGGVSTVRVFAIQAMIVHGDDKLCKSSHMPAMRRFCSRFLERDEQTGRYVWATDDVSLTLIKVKCFFFFFFFLDRESSINLLLFCR